MRSAFLLFPLFAIGCTPAPVMQVAGADAARAAPYPTLVALGPVVAQAQAPDGNATGVDGGRIAALDARAAALRDTVIDAATSDRMEGGVDTSALQ